jgi:hypothetical protein
VPRAQWRLGASSLVILGRARGLGGESLGEIQEDKGASACPPIRLGGS